MALLDVPTPWFSSADLTGMRGIVGYVMEDLSMRYAKWQMENRHAIASFLFFAATLLDLGNEDALEDPWSRGVQGEWTKELSRIIKIRQKTLSGEKTVDRLAERKRPKRSGIDDSTADALTLWMSDRKFCFIRHDPKRRLRASTR